MRKICRIVAAVVLGLAGSACSVTRQLPEESYYLQKVRIEEDRSVPREERITASELGKYVRQAPNKRLLGTNFYVWLYGQANPAKENGWNNWKRRVGEAPVLFDPSLTARSIRNLKVYMDSKGFFSSRAVCEVDTVSRRRRAKVTFRTFQGEPYRIDTVAYVFRDSTLARLILPDTAGTLLHRGDIFDVAVLDDERERITAYLRDRGYYNFSVNQIVFRADTLAGDRRVKLRMVVRRNLAGYDEQGRARMDDNTVYRIDRINLFPDFDPTALRQDTTLLRRLDTLSYRGLNIVYDGRPNVRPSVLRQTIPLDPGCIYNASQVSRTYSELMSLGYFKSARISFEEQAPAVRQPATADPSADTLALTCNILCTPTLRQSFKIDLEGSTTSSFYGLKATVGYQNRNIFRGAESFDISFTTGYEFMKAPDAKKKRATEFGVTTSLTFPRCCRGVPDVSNR